MESIEILIKMAIWGDWKGKQLAISEISACKKRV